ncbi:D-alanine--D-alanine ligase [Candidatus Sneabacter namystus]|uniref:D-alanine--D-alanine ligase n=1 Tax=Candidatus Sneabacter namystus TaxID=2601646 RepID=A0A5C0UH76_9RICK|nr:D-alanine--D-alanine ligase [Candidatus Sneabacter namystus]QEK39495.1 D-alanine--D-alanine ligase [Candidatus Sneabacter namystus]
MKVDSLSDQKRKYHSNVKGQHKSVITDKYAGDKAKVLVLHGGMSFERDISKISSKGVVEALVQLGYGVTVVDVGIDIQEFLLKNSNYDVVYNCLHGTYGEDGCIPSILNSIDLPYTHSGVRASVLGFYKDVTKSMCNELGIITPKAELVDINNKSTSFQFPYVIKPIAQGSSLGVEVVFSGDDYSIENYDFFYGDVALVEEYIEGQEIHSAVLDGEVLGILETRPIKKRFYDYETKYTDGLALHIHDVDITEKERSNIFDVSTKIYSFMNCKGIVRFEFIYNSTQDKSYFLEGNTHPGMTPLSICPEIAQMVGIDFSELVVRILNSAGVD